MSYRALNKASYIFYRILDMVYELNGRKSNYIFGNVITLQIILRNVIPGNCYKHLK